MATLNEIIARAEALRKESSVNSIDPERVGSIMSDTLKYLNEFQLQSGSMGLDKIYASVSAMNADTSPVSDLSGKPLKAGQLAVVVTSDPGSADNGKVYRFDKPGWTYISTVAGLNLAQEPGTGDNKVMSQKAVTDLVSEYNVSVHFPTDGIDGTNRYTLETAIAKIPAALRNVGIKCSFLNEAGYPETWEYLNETAFTNRSSWKRRFSEDLPLSGFVINNYWTYAVSNHSDGSLRLSTLKRAGILVPVMEGYIYRYEDIVFAENFTGNIVVFYSSIPTLETATSLKIGIGNMTPTVVAPVGARYMLICIDYTQNGKNPRILSFKQDVEIKAEEIGGYFKSKKIDSYFIQPKSGARNLFVRTGRLLLSLYNLQREHSLRDYDATVDGNWGITTLIEVKPETSYALSKANTIIEFDENLNLITSKVLGPGYNSYVVKTSENTHYISFNSYTESGVQDSFYPNSVVEAEDIEAEDVIRTVPPVDELWGLKRKFVPYIEKGSITENELADEAVGPSKLAKTTLSLITAQNWAGKRLLAIGDSVTAALKWQSRVGELLKMNVRTHAKGGIGIIQMVDGDGSGDAPEGYDPDNFGVSEIYALNAVDVSNVDIIIIMGFYNERSLIAGGRVGNETDMYPEQNTLIGRLNYAVKRIYDELKKADNMKCKIVVCSAHRYGKYSYSDLTAYDDGDELCDASLRAAKYNSLPFIDLMHNGNINKYNWDVFQNGSSPYSPYYIPADGQNNGTNKPFDSVDSAPDASLNNGRYITVNNQSGCYKSNGIAWVKDQRPSPWNNDQLHPNKDGYDRLGDYIAGFISKL